MLGGGYFGCSLCAFVKMIVSLVLKDEKVFSNVFGIFSVKILCTSDWQLRFRLLLSWRLFNF